MTRRRFWLWLGIITLVGAAWRVGYLLAAKLHDPLLLNDSIYYSIQAGRNSEGAWFRENLTMLPGAEHPPLTSLYLTPWSLGSRRRRAVAAVRHDVGRRRGSVRDRVAR